MEILAPWAAILAFQRERLLAAGLLVPCLAWVTFAAVLTFAIWRLSA